ncbi:helix-turn-helix domain-containing protein [Microbacterium sp. BR1]|uniref:helix-turn-helix domain-containing protein n=1 Tax=Microbacterium sp. BR1 TaxID=1070896 RepID=UPI000C2B70C5|nr:helix-turn-helix domain-containing protein [Microbacterium sp. BR1]
MARGRPVEANVRMRAIELIKSGMPRNAIARELSIAPSSVSRIAAEEELSFDRANQTASATAARQHDLKVRRLELIDELMAKAADHIVAIDQPFLTFNIGGKDNVYTEHTLDRAPTGDILNLHRAASLAMKDARELIHDDDDEGVAEAESMLMNLILELGLHEDE